MIPRLWESRGRSGGVARRFAGFVVVACIVGATVQLAVGQTISAPSTPIPRLPDVSTSTIDIVDLNRAPPVARDAVVAMTLLGAYPIGEEGRAQPNELLDLRTAAYMLVNLFSPRLFDEFPVPAEQALPYLQTVTGTDLAATDPVTVGTLLEFVNVVAGIEAGADEQLRTVLQERYPALRAGNPDAPVTRAGAALMLVITVEELSGDR